MSSPSPLRGHTRVNHATCDTCSGRPSIGLRHPTLHPRLFPAFCPPAGPDCLHQLTSARSRGPAKEVGRAARVSGRDGRRTRSCERGRASGPGSRRSSRTVAGLCGVAFLNRHLLLRCTPCTARKKIGVEVVQVNNLDAEFRKRSARSKRWLVVGAGGIGQHEQLATGSHRGGHQLCCYGLGSLKPQCRNFFPFMQNDWY